MLAKSNYDNLEYRDLTSDLKLICDIAGLEAVRKLAYALEAQRIYIPKRISFDRVFMEFFQNCGRDVKKTAIHFKVSTRTVNNRLTALRKKGYDV
ncbi:MAG: hypothetical protein Kapaf2KO_08570 [Candidatus Kapaibacteriales bacterium]